MALHAELQPDGKVRLSWDATIGTRYRLQATEDLAAAAWRTVYETTAGAVQQRFVDSVANGTRQRYYQLVAD